MSFNEKRFTAVFGALVFLLAVSGYLITVAPTVSFWDCGEFIACSYSMGIPHPPGTPLFVIIGRVVCLLLSFIREIAYRINLISVFANSVTVTLCYLIIVRLLRHWFKPEEEENFFMKFLPIVGGFTGALFTAFSYTWWFNCVEAEVYGIAMLIMVTELWLGFKWQDYRGTPHADRILILIMYLAYLGIGAHLYTMIPVPLIFLYVALQDEEKRKSWQLWLIGFCLLSVMYSISSFLTIGPLLLLYCILWILLEEDTAKKVNGIFLAVVSLYSLKNALPAQDKEFSGLGFILGLVYMALAVLPFVLKTEAKDVERHKWSFCFYIVLFAFLGYSVNFFIPVRSYLDPIIDENNPEVVIEKASDLLDGKKWEQLIYFLERKQYGNESMIMRMFHRRGAFFSQFINHQHMGFGGYLAVQFFNFNDISAGELRLGDNTLVRMGKLLLYLLPLFFVIWAVSYQYRRNRNGTLFLGMALFACTIGLVLYMNFADGTVPEQRDLIQWEKNGRAGPKPEPIQMEVRERDYFFTPGFMLYGMWVGIGFASLLHFLVNRYRSRKRILAPALLALFFAAPALPFAVNVSTRTRADNWVPYDYAFNLLNSCDRDGILFTNGDNDTFPLWFGQEVAGIRRDVKVVNLSLLNTDWYIAQLIDNQPKLEIPTVIFDEVFKPHRLPKAEFLKNMNHRPNRLKEAKKVRLSRWDLEIEIPDARQASFFRVQDYMILNIVHGNAGKRPVYFAVTVSDGNLMGLKPYLIMEGLVYRLAPTVQTQRMDMERTLFNLDQIYRYTYLGSKDLYLSDDNEKLLSNYAASFIGYVYEARAALTDLKAKEKALSDEVNALKGKKGDAAAVEKKEGELSGVTSEIKGILADTRCQLKRCIAILPKDWRARVLAAQFYTQDGLIDSAIVPLKEGLQIDPEEYVYNANLGFLLRDSNRDKEAQPYLEKVVNKLDPDLANIQHRETVGALSALMDIYSRTGQKDKHLLLLQKWTAAHPQDTRALQELEKLKMAP